MPHCFGIQETTGVNRPSWHAASKNKAGKAKLFFSDPTVKPDQRYRAVGIQHWLYNIDSFCYQLFTVCLLRVTHALTQMYDNEEGIVFSFDTYKPGAAKLRCAKTFSFFSTTFYCLI